MAFTPAFPAGGKFVDANKKVRLVDGTFTGSYATGGETVTPVSVGMRRIIRVLGIVTEAAGQTTAWTVYWDNANSKIKLYGAAAGATGLTEHAAAAYAAATVGQLTFIGE